MARYRVLVHGQNLLLDLGEGLKKHGYYQTFWIEDSDRERAEKSAIAAAEDDAILNGALANERNDPPRTTIEEIEEEPSSTPVQTDPTGRAFYPE